MRKARKRKTYLTRVHVASCGQTCLCSALTALFVRGLSKRAIRECEHRGGEGASHRESIAQSVCAPLTQCSLWTLSAVLFLSSQITAFQMGSSLWHSELAQRGDQSGSREKKNKIWLGEFVPPAECRPSLLTRSHNTYATLSSLDNLRSAQFPSCWHFFQNVKSFTWNELHRPSGIFFWECQTKPWVYTKLWIKYNVRWLLIVRPEGGRRGDEDRQPGLRRLSHAALIKCTCNLRLCFVSLNNLVMFILWKYFMTLFPVQLGIIL